MLANGEIPDEKTHALREDLMNLFEDAAEVE